MLYFIFLITIALVVAAPRLDFPVNAQVPPVARVSSSFQFTFSQYTFYSLLPITYSVSNTPSWLQFDPSSRRFSGIPTASDSGPFHFILWATDSTGAVSNNVTFIVSDASAPAIKQSLASQLPNFGAYDGASGLVLSPNADFSFTFSPNTFAGKDGLGSSLGYYAVSADSSPLPSWIKFNSATLTFSGTAPIITSLIAPPQIFGIQLIASDYVGFTGAAQAFNFIVGAHVFEISNSTVVENTTVGSHFSYSVPVATIRLDGEQATRADITLGFSNITSNQWINFDNSSLTLSGTPSSASDSQYVRLTLVNRYNEAVFLNVQVHVLDVDQLFTGTFPDLNVTLGSPFNYTIDSAYLSSSLVKITPSYDPMDVSKWLSYNNTTKTFSGQVPKTAPKFQIILDATLPGSNIRDTQKISVNPIGDSLNPAGIEVLAQPTTDTPHHSTHTPLSKQKIIAIALGITLPVVVVGALCCLFCCYRRHEQGRIPRSESPYNISRPIKMNDTDSWPVVDEKAWDAPRRLSALGGIFQNTSAGHLAGFIAQVPEDSYDQLPPLPFEGKERLAEPRAPPPALTVDTGLANAFSHPETGPPGYGSPRKSWRQSEASSKHWSGLLKPKRRSSNVSMATVSTNELFSLRMVDPADSKNVSNLPRPPIFSITPPDNKLPEITTANDKRKSFASIGSYSSSDEEYIKRYSGGDEESTPQQIGHRWRQELNSDTDSVDSASSPREEHSPRDFAEHDDGQNQWFSRQSKSDSIIDIDDAEYRVATRVSAPMSPVSVYSRGMSLSDCKPFNERPRLQLVEFMKKRRPISTSEDEGMKYRNSSMSGELAFV